MSETNNGPVHPCAPATDALTKWETEANQLPAGLDEIRLDGNERLVIPFTPSVVEVQTHYVDYTSVRGYVRCTGDGCLLCRTGRHLEVRDLLPVFDTVTQAVGVLAVTPNMRPHALRPQLIPVLRQLHENRPVVVGIRKVDRMRYVVALLNPAEEVTDGAREIKEFLDRFNRGEIDLAAVYPRLANEDLAAIPEVLKQMRLRGVSL